MGLGSPASLLVGPARPPVPVVVGGARLNCALTERLEREAVASAAPARHRYAATLPPSPTTHNMAWPVRGAIAIGPALVGLRRDTN
jgi:hypothetical protein